jgi:peptidylprolyl isomerase
MKFLPLILTFALPLFAAEAHVNPKSTKPIAAELIANAKASDWRPLLKENTLYLDIPAGRVVIELAPEFAPQHVANIKALAREKYWDGLAIVRVQDNYVVQWADPNGDKPEAKRKIQNAKETLPAEFAVAIPAKLPFTRLGDKDVYAPQTGFSNGFAVGHDPAAKKSWLLHCYGAIGAGRDVGADSGGGTELYAVIGQAPRHLDRNTTVVGRVVMGMEYLSSLPRGHGQLGFYEKNESSIPIKALHLASEDPDKSELEILRTDTPLFAKLIEARRNRAEDWFHFQAGHIDVCNVNVPVRKKP